MIHSVPFSQRTPTPRGARSNRVWRASVRFAAALSMFAWLIAAFPSVAAAQPAEPSPAEIQVARQLFQEAQADGKEGHWDEACWKLREALKIKVTPGVLFHLAVCEQNRGNYVQALNELGRAEELAEVVVATNVLDLIPDRREQIEARLAKLEIQLDGASDDVRVTLDGSVLSPSIYSRQIPLDPGQHTLAVQNASGREQTRTFSVAAGEVKALHR